MLFSYLKLMQYDRSYKTQLISIKWLWTVDSRIWSGFYVSLLLVVLN